MACRPPAWQRPAGAAGGDARDGGDRAGAGHHSRFSARERGGAAGGDPRLCRAWPPGGGWTQRDPGHAWLYQRAGHDPAGRHAASIDPRTGRRYGSRFPAITVADIVAAQRAALERMGVRHLRAVIGPSYGGFQAFQWAVSHPDFMDGIVPVVTSPLPPQSDRVAGLRAWFEPDPAWNGGDYYETGDVKGTLTRLRVDTLTRYGLLDSLAPRFPDAAARAAELERMAAAWAAGFDANSLFVLGRAMERYDITRHYARIRVPVLYVLSRTDALFPPSLAPTVMDGLRAAGVDATYVLLDSEHGHLASGADADKWAPA
ncbi:MAG: alpha/beta fold hydrolase, partial [Rhodospirillales bacterium]|nr:alpha/beta fold hydrolase [Rhodospirillales bacterium]